MKKRIIIPTVLSAMLTLSSCVKDNESDSVKDLRGAHAEELRASAAEKLAQVDLRKAEAARELAVAKVREAEAAKTQAEASKAAAEAKSAEYQSELVKLNLAQQEAKQESVIEQMKEDAKAALVAAQKAREQAEIDYNAWKKADAESKSKQAQYEAQLAAAEVALLKAKDALYVQKVTAYNQVYGQLLTEQQNLVTKEIAILGQQRKIADAKYNVTVAEALKTKTIKEKNELIARQEAYIKALENVKTKSTAELESEIKVQEAKVAELEFKKNYEVNTSTLEDLEKAAKDLANAFDKSEMITFIQSIDRKIFDGEPNYTTFGLGYFYDRVVLSNKEAISKTGFTNTYSGPSTSPLYQKEVKFNTSDGILGLIDNHVSVTEGKKATNLVTINKLNGDGTGSLKDLQDKVDAAQTAYNDAVAADPVVPATVTSKAAALGAAKKALQEARETLAKLDAENKAISTVVSDYNKLRSILSSGANELRVAYVAEVEKYNTAVQAAADRFFVEEALVQPYNDARKVLNTLNAVKSGYTTFDSAIQTAEQEIANAKDAIAKYHAVATKEEAVKTAESLLAKYQGELEEIKLKIKSLETQLATLKP